MGRTGIAVLLIAVLVGGLALAVWLAVEREREYQQLLQNGDAALASDQTDAAVEAYSGALALKGDSMIAFLRRGEAYRKRGDLGNALRDLRMASRLDPAAERPAELLGDVNYSLERYGKAAESYRQFVDLDERNPKVLYKLALALFRGGDPRGAVDALHKALALDERQAETHYLLGLCLASQKQTTAAMQAFEQATRLSPGLIAPREALAGLYEGLGRPRDAIAQLEAIAALEPNRPERQVAVAQAYARTGRADVAVGILGRATERYPDNAVVYLALGRVWLDTAEPRRDRVALRKAIEAIEPLTRGARASSEALALYGRALMLSGDLAAAAAALQQSVDQLPVSPATLLMLADVSERLGRLGAARVALDRWAAVTSESGPARAGVLERLGDICQRQGDDREAVRAWRKATDGSPLPALFVKLASVELGLGDVGAARATIARGLERNPGHATLVALQRRLQ